MITCRPASTRAGRTTSMNVSRCSSSPAWTGSSSTTKGTPWRIAPCEERCESEGVELGVAEDAQCVALLDNPTGAELRLEIDEPPAAGSRLGSLENDRLVGAQSIPPLQDLVAHARELLAEDGELRALDRRVGTCELLLGARHGVAMAQLGDRLSRRLRKSHQSVPARCTDLVVECV